MGEDIRYRGPDDHGAWYDEAAGVGLGHRRLSIIDLSPLGHQPMHSISGRYVMVFNGEVYNFRELRGELERSGVTFRGHSDTEVMLAAIDTWGLDRALERFIGMFAFALWDGRERQLHLVRDRVGIKPLYYGFVAGRFVFASELKAFRSIPGFEATIDRDALALYFRHNCFMSEQSVFSDVSRLQPGHRLTLDVHPGFTREKLRTQAYWDPRALALQGMTSPLDIDMNEAADQVEALIREAVRIRMVADVPLGAFLSGGIDSSTVVALMQAQSSRPVKTFTIGFREGEFDEADYAREVAAHLGTEHEELYVSPAHAREVIPKLPGMYDEPFADSSQIPTFLVSELARRHVKVSLSGDGGDELFIGYHRHRQGAQLWRTIARLPLPLRRALAGGTRALPDRVLDTMGPLLTRLSSSAGGGSPSGRLKGLAEMLACEDRHQFYRRLVSHWKDPASVVLGATEAPSPFTSEQSHLPPVSDLQQMAFLDFLSYLPNDFLTKVDRASMAVSLEARVPLLDHRLVEFAWRLPEALKARGGDQKRVLRRVLERYVPREYFERRKMGFGVPISDWLRGPLREWMEDLLGEDRLRRDGFLAPAKIRRMVDEHLSGTHDRHYLLWDALMFQAWLDEHTSATATTQAPVARLAGA